MGRAPRRGTCAAAGRPAIASNRLSQMPPPQRPDEVWVPDIPSMSNAQDPLFYRPIFQGKPRSGRNGRAGLACPAREACNGGRWACDLVKRGGMRQGPCSHGFRTLAESA